MVNNVTTTAGSVVVVCPPIDVVASFEGAGGEGGGIANVGGEAIAQVGGRGGGR